MYKYLWIANGHSKSTIKAENEEQALRKVISLRIAAIEQLAKVLNIECAHPAQEAIWRFSHTDMLVSLDVDELDAEPYQGDIKELL